MYLNGIFFISIFLAQTFFVASEDKPTVQTTLGLIQGHVIKSFDGRSINAFEGIRYAKPPLNELRFMDPIPEEPWTGILKATALGASCLQNVHIVTLPTNEDCLYLNVYVPANVSSNSLDVLVNIHGGAFTIGNTLLSGPKFILDRNVVYVNMNYRLGALGFLSTESELVSGNMGLKDQQLALQWVHDHIESFGGNPKSVTLIGTSAGAASSHLHFFSKKSRGLFHRGISHSGCALAPWVIHGKMLEKTLHLAAVLECHDDDVEAVVKCMQNKPAEDIVKASIKLYSNVRGFPIVLFGPVVEVPSENAFVDVHPYCSLTKGDVYDIPWLSSVDLDDGILSFQLLGFDIEKFRKAWNNNVQHLISFNETCPADEFLNVALNIEEFYKNEDFSETEIIKMFGERLMFQPLEKATRLHAKNCESPVYVYRYGYISQLAKKSSMTTKYGVNHGDDTMLLYNLFQGPSNLTKEDEIVKDGLVDIVTSFAKFGKPEKSSEMGWKPVDNLDDKFNLLEIKGPSDFLGSSLNELAPNEFWDSLPIQEYEKIVEVTCKK